MAQKEQLIKQIEEFVEEKAFAETILQRVIDTFEEGSGVVVCKYCLATYMYYDDDNIHLCENEGCKNHFCWACADTRICKKCTEDYCDDCMTEHDCDSF